MIGVTVDPPGATAAITERRRVPFAIVSDPDGAAAIKPFGFWSESEGHSRTGTVVLDPSGREVYRHVGVDALDRPDPAAVLAAVRALELEGRPAVDRVHEHGDPAPSARAFPYDLFAYFRGVRSVSMTLHARTGDDDSAATLAMAERMLADLDDPA